MRNSLWLGSVALNVALAGALAAQHFGLAGRPAAARSTPSDVGSALHSGDADLHGFAWRDLADADLRRYVANLRAAGCPEATILAIVVADLDARDEQAAAVQPAGAAQTHYWESGYAHSARAQAEQSRAQSAGRARRRALLEELFAPDLLARLDSQASASSLNELALDFLDAGQQLELRALREDYARRTATALEWDASGALTEASALRRDELDAEERRAIERVLSPDELLELDLRLSPAADRLRAELVGFPASEREFRELYLARRAYEEALQAGVDVRDPQVLEARLEAEQRLADSARAALGPDRYRDYERSRDPDYQRVLRLTRFFGAPERTAQDVYALQRRVLAQAERITQDPGLSEPQQEAALAEVQSQTERELASLLGARILAEYRRTNRWWIWREGPPTPGA